MHFKLVFASPYLVPGVASSLSFSRVTLSWDPENVASGAIILDRNSCSLDEFGDTGICTQMAFPAQAMKLVLLKEKGSKRLYAIETQVETVKAGQDSQVLPLHLVTDSIGGRLRARLLVLKDDKVIGRVIELEQVLQA